MMPTEAMPYNDPQHQTMIPWACNALTSLGYTLKSQRPEHVLDTPWSSVLRFETSKGAIYCKHTPDLIALEARIIQILHDQCHADVPEVIADNPELHCFLMKDAGRPLRTILKQRFDTALFCKAVDSFTAMQLAVADRIDVLLDIGVPDWRLEQMPDLYQQLLAQQDLLIDDGLSKKDIAACEALLPKVSYLCQQLSSYGIKPTLVQPDFNDNNILIADPSQAITIIDLGEIAISHFIIVSSNVASTLAQSTIATHEF